MTYTEHRKHIRELFRKYLQEFNELPEEWSREQVLRYVFQRGYHAGFPDGVNQAARKFRV